MKKSLKNEKLIQALAKSALPLITLFFLFVKPQKAEAAITFVGANSAVSTAAASITVNKPSGTAEGDVMVAQIFIEDNTNRINSVPSGWINIVNYAPGTNAIRQYIYYKVADASEPASYLWGMNASDEIIGMIVTFRGVNTTTPIGNYATSTSTSSGNCVAPSINVQKSGNWVLHICGNAYGTTYTPPTGFTERVDARTSTGSANISASLHSREYSATGATGNTTATPVNTDFFVASHVELFDAGPPAPPTNVSATDGTHTDKVTITWTKSGSATGYKVYEGSNLIATLGDVATFDDSSAPAPTITVGTPSASDGTNVSHVTLSLSGESANNGSSRTYKVRATNAYGDSDDSNTDTGYRGVGTLQYQWQRSAADSDGSYSDISGATTNPYNDTGAPADGSGRYYRCYLTATGATSQYTSADRGYRNAPPTTVLNSPPDSDSTTDSTPTFSFTATDPDSNPVEYNFQLDTTTTFDSQSGNPLLDKFSVSDSGFTAGHPYSSGSATEFTIQAGDALSPGTYYWRVRATDPTGSNTYGNWATYRTLTITAPTINLSGYIYQSSNETSVYNCSSNNLTIYLKVNGSGSYSTVCDQATGAWASSAPVSSGQTIYLYIYGESVKGSTVLVSDGSGKNDIPIIIDRVVLRDDANGTITNTEIQAGDTTDSDDLISFSSLNMTVGSSYETHIYTGDTFAPNGNVTTGKLHVVGNYTGSTETLTLTGSGTGTSRPLYVDGGTFTVPSTVQFQGTSATDINALTYTNLTLNPTITSGATYTFLDAASANGNFTINPTSTGSNSLSVNLGGDFTVAPTGTITITGTDSGLSVLNTVSGSNYTITAGKLDIQSGGTLTANNSNIYLTGTSSTIFTKNGTFNYGTSHVYFQQTTGSPTLTSGSITFYNATINMSGQTGSAGGNVSVANNLYVTAGTLSIPSTYTLTVSGNTDISGSLTISSTGNQAFTGTTTINSGGTFTRSSASGTNTFGGLLTISNGGTFTTSNNPSFTLQGGLSNSGTFTSGTGTYTFNTNNQSISGSAATTFGGNVSISGAVTIQNSNSNTVTINGDLTGSESGSTYQNNANATTEFKGAVLATGTLTATANPNTIKYTGSSAQTVKATTYYHLYIQPSANSVTSLIGAGTLTVSGDLTIGNGTNTSVVVQNTTNDANISVLGNVTVSANTTFTNSDSTSATLNIDGDLTITGTFTAPAGTNDSSFTLAGDFNKTGTFNHNNGQITLDGTDAAQLNYSSDTTFYQFSVLSASAGKNVQFDETYITIIANDITIQGASCSSQIYLDSTVNDDAWKINIQTGATQDIDYIDLEDADGTSSQQTPVANNSTQTGTNTGWAVDGGVCGPTAPSVVLNSPDDMASTSDTAPTFSFTGTDADSGPIDYEIMISADMPSSWTEQLPTIDEEGGTDKYWYSVSISGDKIVAGVWGGRLYYYNGSSWSEQQPAGNVDKYWSSVSISGDKIVAGVSGGRLYYYNGSSWSEQQPAGNVNKDWQSVSISGDKIVAGVWGGRLYYYNGSSWSEQQPAGNVDKYWYSVSISGDKIVAGVSGGRLYYYNGSSWSEMQPAGNVDKDWQSVSISGDKIVAGVWGGRLYYYNGSSWSEQQPAGNVDKYWQSVSISGDKIVAGVWGGRLYYYNGSSWSEMQPAGNVDKAWRSVSISGDKIVAGVYNGRLYYYNGSSWSEERPAGDVNKYWYSVSISGDKIVAGVYNGRLYYYNGSSWSEQQPAGNVDKDWQSVSISGDKIVAGVWGGRLYYYNGSSWSEMQPAGNVDKDWRSVSISGDKIVAGVWGGRLYYYNGSSWSEMQPAGNVDKAWRSVSISGDKIVAGVYNGRLYYYNGSSWSEMQPAGNVDKAWRSVSISGDKIVAGVYNGRLYYYNGSSWSEQQPAGDVNKYWYSVSISGDKIVAGVWGGRLYYYNGSSWSEQQPAGDVNKYWYSVSISGDKIVAGVYGGRLYTYGTYGVVLYKKSFSDSGFTSGRPYSSGSTIQFTIEETDALEPGTYYWKVRGYNSDLTWMRGDWTETRTLTITLASVNFSGISITGVNIN